MAAGAGEVCRTCLSAQALAPLFPDPAQYRSFQVALRLSTGLQMKENDGLPQFLCNYCSQNVQSSLLFRMQSRIADRRLQTYYYGTNPASSRAVEVDSLSIKSEGLPTAIEIKTEAEFKLSQFYEADLKHVGGDCDGPSTVKEEFGEAFDRHLDNVKSDDGNVQGTDRCKADTGSREKENAQESMYEYWELDFLENKFDPIRNTERETDKTVEQKTSSIDDNSNHSDGQVTDCGTTDFRDVPTVQQSLGTEFKDSSVEPSLSRIERPRSRKRRCAVAGKMALVPDDKEEVYLSKLAKREEFRRKCLELIEGAVDRTSSSFKCKLCHNTYTRTCSFIRHAQRHIGYSNYYDCEHCKKRFSTLNSQVRHIQTSHPQLAGGGKAKKAHTKPKGKAGSAARNADDPEEFRKKCSELMEEPYDKRNETIKCRLCRSVYKSVTAFRKHAQVHLGYRYACEFCQKLYPSRSDLTQHMKKQHPAQLEEKPSSVPPPLKPAPKPSEARARCLALVDGSYGAHGKRVRCNRCQAVCNNMHSFESHAQTHLGFKHLCEFCAKGFPSKAHLKQHLQASHGLARELGCSYCDYKAVVRNQLKVHERRFHTQERPFVCETCGAAYFSKSVLAQHIQLRHETKKRIKCDGCSRTFRLLRELTYHKKLVHQLACTYLCHVCGSTFTKTTSIRKHYLRIHKIPREEQVEKLQRLYNGQPAP